LARSEGQRIPAHRLDPDVRPVRVSLDVEVDPARGSTFRGEVAIELRLAKPKARLRLHAAELRVSRARVELGGATLAARIVPRPEHQMIELSLDRPLRRGTATLRLAFAGRLRRDLCGLYGATAGGRRYAFTQLEATDARRFFPCFDEPAMKAPFRVAVTTGAANAVVSNAPVQRTRRLPGGRKRVVFAETPPLSTYLVALAVGPLERSRPTWLGPTPIRIWHVPGKKRLTAFGLEAARESLARLERYFALPYPYAKLDLVAVPDFEFGAMENAGAVFFRETLLLLDRDTATLAEKKRAAEVIAHELAHMWYGDLVTMAWWDDLWLNEAFATWMAFTVVDDWKREWRMWHDFQLGRAAALELDALRHTHPIYSPVETAAEASENFDLITYEKGAAVVRMLEHYLGRSAFRKGVRAYVRRHREGNTVAADLWRALSDASGEPVERVARAWIEQPGHPVLTVRRRDERGRSRLVLGQRRFLERGRPTGAGSGRWPIPWVGRVGSGRRGRGRLERRLLTRASETVDLGRPPPRFVYGNAEESGFFRPLHGPSELRELLASLPSLTAIERMGLVDHQWALVRARRVGIDSFLDLVSALAGEPDPDVLTALHRPLLLVANVLVPDAAPDWSDRFGSHLSRCFAPSFAALSFEAARDEAEQTRLRRAALLTLVGDIAGDGGVIVEASLLCDRYLANRRSVDANIADGIVTLAARVGDARRHREFVTACRRATTPQEQRRFLLALGAFRDPRLVDKSLALSLTDAVAVQDVVSLLARLLANPAARVRTWEFVRSRWPRLSRRLPPLLASRLVEATWQLATPAHRRQVATFFSEHPLPAGERALRQTLERFDWYRGFRREAAAGLRRWLRRQAD
jgi:puromycin-sensitive aminopeptidase